MEGSACLGDQISTSATHFTKTISSTNLSNCIVYAWVKLSNPDTLANGGLRIVLGDGTNTRAYYVGGSDALGFQYLGWSRLLLDTANPPSNYSQLAGSSAPNFSAITLIGVGGIQPTKVTGNSPNFFWDSIDYVANNTYALTIGGGTSGDPGTFDEIVAADNNNGWGLVRKLQTGVYGVQCGLRFGSASSDSYFKEVDSVIVFEDPPVNIATSFYKMSFLGNSGSTNSFILGNKVGSGDTALGSNGVSIQSAGPTLTVDFDATNFDTIKIYGSKFYKIAGGITLSSNTAHEFIGNTVDQCGQVDAKQMIIRNCTFSGTTDNSSDGSALLWNNNINIKNCAFNANTHGTNDPHGIEHPDSGTFTYDNLTFSGNDYDIEFSASSGTLTINATNGSNPGTYEITGGGSSVSINNAVTVLIHVEDKDGNNIQGARVGVFKESDGSSIMTKETGSDGNASTSYNYLSDVPIIVRVRKASSGSEPQYLSYSTKGTITSSGYTLTVILYEDKTFG